MNGTVIKVSGPLVVANGLADANVSDVVRVGDQRLIGEILNMTYSLINCQGQKIPFSEYIIPYGFVNNRGFVCFVDTTQEEGVYRA